MMNLIDKLLVKLGYARNNSPTFKAKMEEGNISQKHIQIGNGGINIEGDLATLPYSWSEKKDAAESLIKALERFFFSAIGRNGVGGFLTPQNLDATGRIKESCLLTCRKEFVNACEKLKTAITENAPKLNEQDQQQLHKLRDSLIGINMYEITKDLREESISRLTPILEKYFNKPS